MHVTDLKAKGGHTVEGQTIKGTNHENDVVFTVARYSYSQCQRLLTYY